MKVCVTGASGFVGRHLMKELRETKYDVVTIGRNTKYNEIYCDLSNCNGGFDALDDCDTLINVAGLMPGEYMLMPAIDVNIRGTMNLVSKMKNLKRVVQISTTDVYGTKNIGPVTEETRERPETYYAASKLAAEKLLQLYCDNEGISLVILRMCIMYGPYEWHDRFIPNSIRSALGGDSIELWGDGSDSRDYLYVGDGAKAIVKAVGSGCTGVYNVASGYAHTKKEVAEMIVDIAGGGIVYTHPEYRGRHMRIVTDMGFEARTGLKEGLKREIEWFERTYFNGSEK